MRCGSFVLGASKYLRDCTTWLSCGGQRTNSSKKRILQEKGLAFTKIATSKVPNRHVADCTWGLLCSWCEAKTSVASEKIRDKGSRREDLKHIGYIGHVKGHSVGKKLLITVDVKSVFRARSTSSRN